jgi:hypothetical protein
MTEAGRGCPGICSDRLRGGSICPEPAAPEKPGLPCPISDAGGCSVTTGAEPVLPVPVSKDADVPDPKASGAAAALSSSDVLLSIAAFLAGVEGSDNASELDPGPVTSSEESSLLRVRIQSSAPLVLGGRATMRPLPCPFACLMLFPKPFPSPFPRPPPLLCPYFCPCPGDSPSPPSPDPEPDPNMPLPLPEFVGNGVNAEAYDIACLSSASPTDMLRLFVFVAAKLDIGVDVAAAAVVVVVPVLVPGRPGAAAAPVLLGVPPVPFMLLGLLRTVRSGLGLGLGALLF